MAKQNTEGRVKLILTVFHIEYHHWCGPWCGDVKCYKTGSSNIFKVKERYSRVRRIWQAKAGHSLSAFWKLVKLPSHTVAGNCLRWEAKAGDLCAHPVRSSRPLWAFLPIDYCKWTFILRARRQLYLATMLIRQKKLLPCALSKTFNRRGNITWAAALTTATPTWPPCFPSSVMALWCFFTQFDSYRHLMSANLPVALLHLSSSLTLAKCTWLSDGSYRAELIGPHTTNNKDEIHPDSSVSHPVQRVGPKQAKIIQFVSSKNKQLHWWLYKKFKKKKSSKHKKRLKCLQQIINISGSRKWNSSEPRAQCSFRQLFTAFLRSDPHKQQFYVLMYDCCCISFYYRGFVCSHFSLGCTGCGSSKAQQEVFYLVISSTYIRWFVIRVKAK